MSDDFNVACMVIDDTSIIPTLSVRQNNILHSYLSNNYKIRLGEDVMEKVITLFKLMEECTSDTGNPYRQDMLTSFLMIMICLLLREMESKMKTDVKETRPRNQQIFLKFMSDIEQHCVQERNLEFYAGLQCISQRYLSAAVKDASGKTASDWIREFVLLEAKALIKSRKYTIQEISIRLNFPNQSFFGTWFKKAAGMSPKQYQEKG